MPRFRKKGLAAGASTVDAGIYPGDGLYRDALQGAGLPYSPGPGAYAVYTDLPTGQFRLPNGVVVPAGQWVVSTPDGLAAMPHTEFEANYEPA